ncbi:heavy-metal-associated domain-containing protein [Sandarakinorhabdus sp.]|uniref:heavy-metal-associated domain-containing protein n=1 Tax=Sandarakinorhabdus sp. TaxID=1916663 RepID=UPI00333E64A7
MNRILPVLAGLGLLAVVAAAQQSTPKAVVPPPDPSRGGGNAYAVGGIDVDVTARSVDDARRVAWTAAQRKAWPQLWSRLTGRAEAEAPRLADGQIDAMVAGIESQGERFSDTRYIARLGVVFDRSRVVERLGSAISLLQSPPMLLLPLLVDGGAGTLFQGRNAWADAWGRWRGNVTPMDYVLPPGTPSDNLWLTMWQAGRSERSSWQQIISRFDTVDVLLAEARLTRSFPGGPITAVFTARHGPDGLVLGRFSLRVTTEAGLPRLLEDGVRRIDMIYADALRAGQLQADAGLAIDVLPIIDAEVLIGQPLPETSAMILAAITPDTASLVAAERLLRSIAGDVLVRQSAVGGTSRIEVAMPGGEAALAEALAKAGWQLERLGNDLVLRRRLPAVPAAIVALPAAVQPAPVAAKPAVSPAQPVPLPAKLPANPPAGPPAKPPAPATAT